MSRSDRAKRNPFALALSGLCCLFAAAVATASEGVPLLVTVDDLPLTGGSLHATAGDREAATRGMLAALARHRVPAVGLVTWGNVHGADDLRLLELWLAGGHELGNHSDRHLDYHRTGTDAWLADVERSRSEIAAFLAARSRPPLRFFRFPFLREGDTDAKLDAARAYLASTGQRNLPVTIDDQDWSFERPYVEASRSGDRAGAARVAAAYHESLHLSVRHHRETARELFDRDVPQILLLHGTAIGAAEWDRLFTWLEGEGFRFASADEVLADPAYERPPHFLGPRGPGLWDRIVDERRRQEADAAVRALLENQVAAWNRGDLEAFVAAYADEALFVSPSGVTRGSGEVLARYRRRYPDGKAMGRLRLELSDVRLTAGGEVSMLGDAVPGRVHGARVLARWTLTRDDGAPARSGPTLIVLERRDGTWRIVEDASMEDEGAPAASGG
ncbi:MAG: SgcJ/EcaC family oxidoreductase [Thermoanaerobaculia bacterium]